LNQRPFGPQPNALIVGAVVVDGSHGSFKRAEVGAVGLSCEQIGPSDGTSSQAAANPGPDFCFSLKRGRSNGSPRACLTRSRFTGAKRCRPLPTHSERRA
jgi:hypothetical protein